MLPSDQFKILPWLSLNNNTVIDVKNHSLEINDTGLLNHNSTSPHSNHNTTSVRTRGHAPPPPQNNVISPYGTHNSVSSDCLHKCRTALFSIPSYYHSNNLYLVVRVDKVLSGPINIAVEKYLKNNTTLNNGNVGITMSDCKTGSSIQRSMVNYCRNIGRYRMPFAWGARSLTSSSRFIHLFKMDSNKTSEQGLIQSVQMLSRLSTDSSSVPTYKDGCANLTSGTTTTTITNNNDSSTIDANHHNIPESLIQMSGIQSSQLIKSSKTIGNNNNANLNNRSPTKDNTFYPTEQDRIFIDMAERSLKTQMLPFRFELITSELIDQYADPNAKIISRVISSNLETFIPTINLTTSSNSFNCYIPSTHPTLMSDEVIREVENLFDFTSFTSSSTAVGTFHNDDCGSNVAVCNSDDANSPSRTGSLQRGYRMNSLTGKNNRDSILSNASMGSLPGTLVTTDLPRILNTTTPQIRANSLDRPDQLGNRNEHGLGLHHNTASKLLPFTSFFNTLYVCPKSLNMSVKHNFPRARNLSCFIELRSNDTLDSSAALKVFYTRPSVRQSIFDSWFNTSVMYHDTSPDFGEQAKICLPLNLTSEHHLLFRFYHVSCETAATNLIATKDKSSSYKKPVESSTGYSWIPILGTDGNLNVGTFQLRVASTIQPGYLKHSTVQSTRSSNNQNVTGTTLSFINSTSIGNTNNSNSVDLTWIDNGKYLFKVDLKPLSSIYTHDPVLSRFFRVCGDLLPRVLFMSPWKSAISDKQKQNRVTFRDDLIVQSNNNDVPTTKRTSSINLSNHNNTGTSSTSILQNATSISLHLCNAMKAMLLISPTGLVQFLPIILNQFMEIIILSSETSARWFHLHQQQQQSSPQSSDSTNNHHLNILEYSWFKSLKNNFTGNNSSSSGTSNSTPDDVLKTAVSTLAMLISELNAQIPNDSLYYPLHSTHDMSCSDSVINSNTTAGGDRLQHNLLKTYVEFAFNPEQLLTICINHYLNEKDQIILDTKNEVIDKKMNLSTATITAPGAPMVVTATTTSLPRKSIINQYFPLSSLHHSIIRGLILVLWDTHCPGHILAHLFNNIWFSLALIIKSMTQYLCTSKKIWAERSGESRFSSLFCEDLTVFIQLIGSRLLSSFGKQTTTATCILRNKNNECLTAPLSTSSANTTPLCQVSSSNAQLSMTSSSNSLSISQTSKSISMNETLTPRNSLGESISRQTHLTKHTSNDVFDFNRIDVICAMGQFLGHLFNLMDRGYVLKRVRDLLIFLEISPRMSVDKIDQLNELRFELMRCICEHEHFIQLNLPLFNVSDGLNAGIELVLTDHFCQQHFLIGILFNQLSCLLSGCLNTGSWALLKSTSQRYRQPITILRNLLIKHSLDPRYRNSKSIQARICSLYLPFVRLMLDYCDSLGPPGGALQTAVIAAAVRRDYEESLLVTDGNSNSGTLNLCRRQRSMDKSNKTNKANSATTNVMYNSSISHRPQSMLSDYSLETLNNSDRNLHATNSDNESFTSLLSANSESNASSIHSASNGRFSHGRSSLSSGSHNITTNDTNSYSQSAASAAYLTKDGKVQKHILDQIAGVDQGGALQRVYRSNRVQDNSSISTSSGIGGILPNSQYPRSQSIHSVDGQQNSCLLSSHTSSSTLTLTGVDMDNNNNNNMLIMNGSSTPDEEYFDASQLNYKNGENFQKHHSELSPTPLTLEINLQNSDQDWAKQVLTLAGVYQNCDNSVKSTKQASPNAVSTPVELPLEVNISEIEHLTERQGNSVSGNPLDHPHSHHLSHQSSFQKIFLPDLLLTKDQIIRPHVHHRPCEQNNSGPRRLTDNCQRDLYICLLHILSTITVTHLKVLLQSFTVQERLRFLNILKFCVQHLRYRGRHCIQQYEHISHSGVGRTGGTGNLLNISSALASNAAGRRRTNPVSRNLQHDIPKKNSHEVTSAETVEDVPKMKVLLKANLANESSLIILDLLSTFATVFKSELNNCKPSDPVFRCLLETYIVILSNNPSDHVIRHTFSALRVFTNQNAQALFSESTDILSILCLAGLRCSNQCFLSLSSTACSPSLSTTSSPVSNLLDSNNDSIADKINFDTNYLRGKPPSAPRIRTTEVNEIDPILLNNNNYDNDNNDHINNQAVISKLCLDACGFLYRLWKCSFETHHQAGFHRVHLQTIIAISKLVSEISPGFEASLSLLHSLAQTDMHRSSEVIMTKTTTPSSTTTSTTPTSTVHTKIWTDSNIRLFLDDIDDLIRRILTVLTATAEMRRHCDDPERIVDLQYALAKSYSSNPALRRTWLEELAKLHLDSRSFTEFAMTKLHIAALMAEYLRRRGILDREFPQGCDAFQAISSNIHSEESGLRTDSTVLEISYTQEDLLTDLNEAAVALESAGLFECIRPVYALILPVYEYKCQYTNLALIYHHIGRAYEAISRVESHGHRLFASYYRVTFHGQLFESMAGKSFIYRSNPCQKLNEKCNELLQLYRSKYGENVVELIADNFINRSALDANKAYVQVTYVEPYKEKKDSDKKPLTSYEKHHDVRQFMFETPFLRQPGLSTEACLLAPGPKRSDDLTIQWKRRTILTTEATFPHLRRRLEIIQVTETDFTPIDSAIDAIQCKNQELMSHVITLRNNLVTFNNSGNPNESGDNRVSISLIGLHSPVLTANTTVVSQNNNNNSNINSSSSSHVGNTSNIRKQQSTYQIPLLMDMQLQGALLPTVNAGPMAYAQAFLKVENQSLYPAFKVNQLKELFFDFLSTCLILLTHYYNLMSSVHEAKYCAMREALDRYRIDLSNLLKEEVVVDEKELRIRPKSSSSQPSG
ncbi:unnamed protein product [Heterobilharzia americana]|nr:unnamed protein product [Heterobilharzia americana]